MKLIRLAGGVIVAAALAASTAAAQSTTVKEKTKVEVKGGKNVTIRGCLDRSSGGGYLLTDSEGGLKYALVTDDDLSSHVGHRVEVRGKAADKGDARVKIEHSVGTGGQTAETKTDVPGDQTALPYLGVRSVKNIAGSCQ